MRVPGRTISYKYAVALTVALGLFMAVFDSTIVNVAPSTMVRDFGTMINAVRWVVTDYSLAQAAVIPVPVLFVPAFGPVIGGAIVGSPLGWPAIFFI